MFEILVFYCDPSFYISVGSLLSGLAALIIAFCVVGRRDSRHHFEQTIESCLIYDRSGIDDLYFDETYNCHEDYIFWLTILKRGIVAKGNHNVLATYVIHSNSKDSNQSKLVKSMYRVYHESQGFNWLKSWTYVFRYAFLEGGSIRALDRLFKSF